MERETDVLIERRKTCDVRCSLINKENLKTCCFRPYQSPIKIICTFFYKKVNKFFVTISNSSDHPQSPIIRSTFYKMFNKFFMTIVDSKTHPQVQLTCSMFNEEINKFFVSTLSSTIHSIVPIICSIF